MARIFVPGNSLAPYLLKKSHAAAEATESAAEADGRIGPARVRGTGGFVGKQPGQQIGQQMLCSHTRIDSHRLRTGMLTEEEYGRLTMGAGVPLGARNACHVKNS